MCVLGHAGDEDAEDEDAEDEDACLGPEVPILLTPPARPVVHRKWTGSKKVEYGCLLGLLQALKSEGIEKIIKSMRVLHPRILKNHFRKYNIYGNLTIFRKIFRNS